MDELTVTIASWFDWDDLVIELEAPTGDFGLVTIDPSSGAPTIETYPPTASGTWRSDLAAVRAALDLAQQSAQEIASSPEQARVRSTALAATQSS